MKKIINIEKLVIEQHITEPRQGSSKSVIIYR